MAATVTSDIPSSSAILVSKNQGVATAVTVTLNSGGPALTGSETIEATSAVGNVTVEPSGAQKVTVTNDPSKGTVTFKMTVPKEGVGQVGFTGQAAGVHDVVSQPSGAFTWSGEYANANSFKMQTIETDYIMQEWDGTGNQPFLPVIVAPVSESGKPYVGLKLGFYGTNYGNTAMGFDRLNGIFLTASNNIASKITLSGIGPGKKYIGHDFVTDDEGVTFFVAPKKDNPVSLSYNTWCYALNMDIQGGSLNLIPPYTDPDPTLAAPGFLGAYNSMISPDQGDQVIATIPGYTDYNPGDVIALYIEPDGQNTIVTQPKVVASLKKVGDPESFNGYWEYPVSPSCFPSNIQCNVNFIQIQAQSGNPGYSDMTLITNTGSSSPAPDPNANRTLLAPKVYSSLNDNGDPDPAREIESGSGWINVPNVTPYGITIVVPAGNPSFLNGKNISGVAILYGVIGHPPVSAKTIDLTSVAYSGSSGATWHIKRAELMFIDDDNNADGHCWIYYSSTDGSLSHIWQAYLDTMASYTPPHARLGH